MKKPLVSIITVTFNSEKTLKDTMESVLNQTYKNIEYIIIDGSSKDNTVEIAKSYEVDFKNQGISFKIISEKDDGIYDAMNKGINLATGEIVGIINSDDWYGAETIEKIVNEYKKSNYDLLYGDLMIVKKNSNIKKKAALKNYVSSRNWNHPTMFVKRSYYDNNRYEKNKLYSDFGFWLKARKNNANIVVLNETLAYFRTGGVSNDKELSKVIYRIKERYYFYRSNGYSKWYFIESVTIEISKAILA